MIHFRYSRFTDIRMVLYLLISLLLGLCACNDDLPETAQHDDKSYSNAPIVPPLSDNVIPGMRRTPVVGHIRGLALLISFKDQEFKSTQVQYEEVFNGDAINPLTSSSTQNLSSVKRYYLDQSNGKLALTHEVTPILHLSRPREAYTDIVVFVSDAIEVLNRDYPDFVASRKHLFTTQMLDFDGVLRPVIQALSIVISGPSGRPGDYFYPHAGDFIGPGSLPTSSVKKAVPIGHDLYLSRYQLTPELRYISGRQYNIATIGVLCHELGHAIAEFRDYYDNSTAGLGYHCLMSVPQLPICPPPLNPYLKWLVGWAEFKPLPNSATNLTIRPDENNTYYVYVNPRNPQEMYILENRFKQKDTWTEILVSEGLGIWHVDNTVTGNFGAFQWVPTSEKHYEISFVQAGVNKDNYQDKALTWSWSGFTFFNGNKDDCFGSTDELSEFSHETDPASNWWSGEPSGMTLSNIKLDKTTGDITLHYSNGLTEPSGQTVAITDIPQSVLEGEKSCRLTVTTTNIPNGEILKLAPPNDKWKGTLTGTVNNNKVVFELISPSYDRSRNSTTEIDYLKVLWGAKLFECEMPHRFTLVENNPPLTITVTPSKSTVSSANESITLEVNVKNMIDYLYENKYQVLSSKLRIATGGQYLTSDGKLSFTAFGLSGSGTITDVDIIYGQNSVMNGIQYHETRVTVPLSTPITIKF